MNPILLWLSFTGWLQFLFTLFIAFGFFLIAGLGWIIGYFPNIFFWIPLILGVFMILIFIFDVITLKFDVRPKEKLPLRRDDIDAFDLMRVRHSCRSFQSRNLTTSDHHELMQCVRMHQTSFSDDLQIRLEYIRAEDGTAWPISNATEFLIAIAPRKYNRLAVIDVGRFLQNVVLHATRMGLGTCWIGPGANHSSVERHLSERFNPKEDHVICICAIGYASWFCPLVIRYFGFSARLPLSSIFFSDKNFQKPLDVSVYPFNIFGRCYEVCQWYPTSHNLQPIRAVAIVNRDSLVRFDFFDSAGSRFYSPVALGIWCTNWEIGCNALEIDGGFRVLSPKTRGVKRDSDLMRYDISWILKKKVRVLGRNESIFTEIK